MPRIRGAAGIEGLAPVELRDPAHAVWQSARATADWLDRAGLWAGGRTFTDESPLNRHDKAAQLWAVHAGLTRKLANGRDWPDWSAMRVAGIPADSGDRLVEQLAWEGVRVLDE